MSREPSVSRALFSVFFLAAFIAIFLIAKKIFFEQTYVLAS